MPTPSLDALVRKDPLEMRGNVNRKPLENFCCLNGAIKEKFEGGELPCLPSRWRAVG